MQNDVRSRKWLITINNPSEKGFNHNAIKAQLQLFKNCIYWCMSDEVGKEGDTIPHTHFHMLFWCGSVLYFEKAV